MDSTGTKRRFGRCPKCRKLLVENPNVPEYRCRNCGHLLRAKDHNEAAENTSSALIKSDGYQSEPGTLTEDSRSVSSGEQVHSCLRSAQPTEVENDVEAPSFASSSPSPSSMIERRAGLGKSLLSENFLERRSNTSQFGLRSRSSCTYAESACSSEDGRNKSPVDDRRLRSRRTINRRIAHHQTDTGDDSRRETANADAESDGQLSNSTYYSATSKSLNQRSDDSSLQYEHEGQNLLSSQDFKPKSGPSKDSAAQRDVHELVAQMERMGISKEQICGLLDLTGIDKEPHHLHMDLPQLGVNTRFRSNSTACNHRILSPRCSCFRCRTEEQQQQVMAAHCHERSWRNYARNTSSQSSFTGSPRTLDQDLQKSNSKGRRKAAKYHCRPVLGGAPFVICNSCFKPIQLPTAAASSKRRSVKLQCGACFEILTLSFPASGYMDHDRGGLVAMSKEYDRDPTKSHTRGSSSNEQGDALHHLMGYESARYLLDSTDLRGMNM